MKPRGPRVLDLFYRAVDSTGETIDFLLSPKRNAVAAKHVLQMAMWHVNGIRARVINVDGHAAYPQAIRELKASRETMTAVPMSANIIFK